MGIVVEQHGSNFYLRAGKFYIGDARKEADALLWAKATELRDALAQLIPLVPPQGIYQYLPPEVAAAQSLLDELPKP